MIYFIKNNNFYGLVAILAWSFFPLIILGFKNTSPLLGAGLSYLIAGVIGCLYYRFRGVSLQEMFKASLMAYALVVTAFTAYVGFLLYAFTLISPFEATVLNYLWPIFLLCFSLFSSASLSRMAYLSVVLGFLGVVSLYIDNIAIISYEGGWQGYVCAIIAALIWATYSRCTKFVKFQNANLPIFMIASSLFFLLVYLFVEDKYVVPEIREMAFILLFGFTRLSFILWDYAMKYGDIEILAPLSYLTPFLAMTLLVIFGCMPLTLWDGVGGGLIILATIIAQVRKRKNSVS